MSKEEILTFLNNYSTNYDSTLIAFSCFPFLTHFFLKCLKQTPTKKKPRKTPHGPYQLLLHSQWLAMLSGHCQTSWCLQYHPTPDSQCCAPLWPFLAPPLGSAPWKPTHHSKVNYPDWTSKPPFTNNNKCYYRVYQNKFSKVKELLSFLKELRE